MWIGLSFYVAAGLGTLSAVATAFSAAVTKRLIIHAKINTHKIFKIYYTTSTHTLQALVYEYYEYNVNHFRRETH